MDKIQTTSEYIDAHLEWEKELILLRELIKSNDEIGESIKWGTPIYTVNDKNVIGVAAFKSYVGIWFHQGVFLSDKKKLLINANEEKTRALRQWRFNNFEEIENSALDIISYVNEAVLNQNKGKVLKAQRNKPLIIPLVLKLKFESDPELIVLFKAFNLTEKREFVNYVAAGKKAETRAKRVDKIVPFIIQGVGLYKKYKK